MIKINEHPEKRNAISKAGITIHLDQSEERAEPLDITLYIKKPEEGENASILNDEDNVTTTGKLTFKFGKHGLVEIFAESTSPIIKEIKI